MMGVKGNDTNKHYIHLNFKGKIMNHPQLKLLGRVRLRIRIKGYSIRTEKSYVSWIKRFILFHNKRHPNEMGKVEIEAFLSYIVSFAPALTNRTAGYVTRSSGSVGGGSREATPYPYIILKMDQAAPIFKACTSLSRRFLSKSSVISRSYLV